MADASHHDALMRLCAHFGIAPDYFDIFGHRHVIAEENLRSLLNSFGIDAALPPQQELQRVERKAWRHAMPPALAIRAGESHWSLTLRVPAAQPEAHWILLEEDGTRRDGRLSLHALPELSRTDVDGVPHCERRISLSLALPVGYHRLSLEGHAGETLLIAAPAHCYRPPALSDDGRVWGPAVQLYALRSRRNWGIGDFGDLAQLAQQAAERGAGIIGLNPLHALFSHNPAHTSPYSPSSRQALCVLYIDVEAIDDFRDCEAAQRLVQSPDFQARLSALRETERVDYPGVAAAKLEVLELLYAHFRSMHLEAPEKSPEASAFAAFRASGGAALRRHALFEALQAHFHAADGGVWGWPVWPEAYRDPNSPEVEAFAEANAERIG